MPEDQRPLAYCRKDMGLMHPIGECPYDDRKARAEEETGYKMDTHHPSGERIAWDREEADECEKGTPGCSVHHTRDTECQTW